MSSVTRRPNGAASLAVTNHNLTTYLFCTPICVFFASRTSTVCSCSSRAWWVESQQDSAGWRQRLHPAAMHSIRELLPSASYSRAAQPTERRAPHQMSTVRTPRHSVKITSQRCQRVTEPERGPNRAENVSVFLGGGGADKRAVSADGWFVPTRSSNERKLNGRALGSDGCIEADGLTVGAEYDVRNDSCRRRQRRRQMETVQ